MPLFAELRVDSSSVAIKGMSHEEFFEKFAEDEENDKVVADFYPLSNDNVMFQRSEIPVEGQPLLAAIEEIWTSIARCSIARYVAYKA